MSTLAERLQPYIVAEHRRANGMAGVNLDGADALSDPDILAYARGEITRLRMPGLRGVLAENDHESKIRCQALERMLARYEEQKA